MIIPPPKFLLIMHNLYLSIIILEKRFGKPSLKVKLYKFLKQQYTMLNGTVAEGIASADLTVPSFFRLEERTKELCAELGLRGKPGVYSYLDEVFIGACSDLERELIRQKTKMELMMPEAYSLWIEICMNKRDAEKRQQKLIEKIQPEYNETPLIFFKLRERKNSGLYNKLGLGGKCGVYIYLNKHNKPTYIGSSTSLAERLTCHKRVSEKYMPDADALLIQVCDNYIERELNLIRKHCPKYNKLSNPQPNKSVESITVHTN
jgi:hypothetical protein